MLLVDVAEIAQELATLDLEAIGEAAGMEPAFFEVDVTLSVDSQVKRGIEIGIDGCGEGDFGLTEIEPVLRQCMGMIVPILLFVDMQGTPGHECLSHQCGALTVDAVVVVVAVQD